MRQLIITADDFGLHPAINDAIQHTHRHGVLTHTSIMTEGPAFQHAIDIAEKTHTLSVGIHLSFPGNVSGSGLTDLLKQSIVYSFNRRKILAAWRAQIIAAKEHGISPCHLDSHQHIHLFPGLFSCVLELALEFDIHRVRGLNLRKFGDGTYRASAIVLGFLQFVCVRLWGNKTNTVIPSALGFFESGKVTENRLMHLLSRAERGSDEVVEIFCHPGNSNDQLQRSFGWNYDWESEMKALCDPAVREKVRRLTDGEFRKPNI